MLGRFHLSQQLCDGWSGFKTASEEEWCHWFVQTDKPVFSDQSRATCKYLFWCLCLMGGPELLSIIKSVLNCAAKHIWLENWSFKARSSDRVTTIMFHGTVVCVFVMTSQKTGNGGIYWDCCNKHHYSVRTTTRLIPACVLPAGIRAYEQLGFRAFGTPGKMATGIAITLQNIGCEVPAWLSQ